jgi:RNA-directed DNA polymerase
VEGPTDVLHLEAALRWFIPKGSFTNLELTFQEQSGDQELLKAAKVHSKLVQESPCICLFDRDNPAILKDVCDGQGGTKDWGNGVFSFVVPVPLYRSSQERICIEMLYPDEVLRCRDASGRRLYLRSEFDSQSGMHLDEDVHCTNPQSKTIVVEEAYERNKKVSLSKHEFAQLISKKDSPFDAVSFEGFRGILETLDRIRRGWQGSQPKAS